MGRKKNISPDTMKLSVVSIAWLVSVRKIEQLLLYWRNSLRAEVTGAKLIL